MIIWYNDNKDTIWDVVMNLRLLTHVKVNSNHVEVQTPMANQIYDTCIQASPDFPDQSQD